MKRKIIQIDEEKCNGCGACIPGCPEGAIQVIDGKARLINDRFCDGLGACLGNCPEGAIKIEEREAEEYDEYKTMENIIQHGKNVIQAHLKHLKDHDDIENYEKAKSFLKEKGINMQEIPNNHQKHHSGCPGSRMREFSRTISESEEDGPKRVSRLGHWPVQLHLIQPRAPYYQKKDVLLTADCVAYALADFHEDYLKGKSLAIACPKLDEGKEIYIEKIKVWIDEAKINTLTVIIMEVPCCQGLLQIAVQAAKKAERKIPIKSVIVSLNGEVLSEDWVAY